MQEPSLPGAGAGRDPDRGELVYFWFVCLFTVKSEEPEVSDSAGLGRSLEVCVSSTFRPRGCGPAVPGLLLGAHDYGEGRKERKANMRQPSGVARLGMYGPPGPA